MPVPPESLIVNDVPDGNRSNWSNTTVTSSSKNFLTTRTNKNAPTATTGGPNLAQTPEDPALIAVSFPLPTYTPHESGIRVLKTTWSEEFPPAVPIYSDVYLRRGRRTEAAGRKESPEGLFIDFSSPSVPSYMHEPVAGGFSVPPSNKGIGNTATMHRPEASLGLIPPYVPTTEQNYSTNPLMTTDPLRAAYGSKYAVLTDTSDTSLHDVDTFLIQASQALSLHSSSDKLPFADIALNAGPASWIKSDFNKPHPSDPTTPKIQLQTTEIVESTKHSSDEAKIKQIQDTKDLQDTFIPSTVPEEIQAIIDSYLSGRPLLLVISNKRFFDYWSLRLPKEFGFFMLGYFRILGVQVLTFQILNFCVDINILHQGISSSF